MDSFKLKDVSLDFIENDDDDDDDDGMGDDDNNFEFMTLSLWKRR